jgi:ribosome hibernation promoting factor
MIAGLSRKELTMTVNVTSRHFKAHQTLVEYAERSVESLEHYYDGIIKCDIVLKFEKTRKSTKIAEVVVSVARHKLAAEGQSDDFFKAIDGAVQKVQHQIQKYKERLRMKDRNTVRRVREKV